MEQNLREVRQREKLEKREVKERERKRESIWSLGSGLQKKWVQKVRSSTDEREW